MTEPIPVPAAGGPAAGAGDPAPAVVRKARRIEYVVCLFLVVVGVVVVTNALALADNRTGVDPLGPRPIPLVVGALLIVLAVALAFAVRKGDLAEAESGEDVDLSIKVDIKTTLLLIGVFAANIVLIDILGWVISGGLLFYGCAVVLGSRHFVRDFAISAALGLITFYGFAIGLGVPLPAGILQGIL